MSPPCCYRLKWEARGHGAGVDVPVVATGAVLVALGLRLATERR